MLCPALFQQLRCSTASTQTAWLSFPYKLLICALSFFSSQDLLSGIFNVPHSSGCFVPHQNTEVYCLYNPSIFCSGSFLYVRAGICLHLPVFCPFFFFFILKHFFSVCFLVFPGPANQKDEEVKLHKCILKKDADPALMPSRLNGIELRPLLVLKQNSFSK